MSYRAVIFTILILVLVGIGIAWWYSGSSLPGTTAGLQTYQSQAYGYTFSYPDQYTVNPYSPQVVAVGTTTDGQFNAVAYVAVGESEASTTQTYDEFVFSRAATLCAADGPDESLSCDMVASTTPFAAGNGLSGDTLMLQLLDKKLSTGQVATSTYGPVYVYNIGANVPQSQYAAIFVFPPLASYLQGADTSVVTQVADSMQVNRVETGAPSGTTTATGTASY